MEETLQELNHEYVKIINEMRELNKKRYEILKAFENIIKGNVDITIMRTPSIYHDLYGHDLDIDKK